MDYKGQKLCEYIYSIIIIFFDAVAWIVGYVYADFTLTIYGWAAGLALALILCIPDWPMYNRNKVIWLEEIGRPNKVKSSATKVTATSTSGEVTTKDSKKSKKQ